MATMEPPRINADQNFYSRSNGLRAPANLHQTHASHHLDSPGGDDDVVDYIHEGASVTGLRSASTSNYDGFDFGQLSSPLVNASNALSYDANKAVGLDANDSLEPDSFYKAYKGVQQFRGGYTDVTTTGMAPNISEHRAGVSSSRSNGNGTTPKHPAIVGTRNGVKLSYRSTSAPLDIGSPNVKPVTSLNGNAGAPKVKDLLKKFDANNSAPSAVPRPYPRSIATRKDMMGGTGVAKARAGYMAQINSGGKAAEGLPQAGPAIRTASGSTVKITQRPRLTTEDLPSSNTFASSVRSTPEKAAAALANGQTSSQIATDLPTTSPRSPQQSRSTSQPPKKAPLFGEVVDSRDGGLGFGYGIAKDIPPLTSPTSSSPNTKHGRRRSDPDRDVSPSSPTAWYLGVTPSLSDLGSDQITPGHDQIHSEVATMATDALDHAPHEAYVTGPPMSPTKTQDRPRKLSKLPVSSHKLNNTPENSSPSSARPLSPLMNRKTQGNKLQKATQRSGRPILRAPTPSNGADNLGRPSSRIAVRRYDETKMNGSLNAHVTAPLAQKSPPLRSSRPRVPVQVASTESSRARLRDRSRSPNPTSVRVTRNVPDDEGRSHGDSSIGKAQMATAAARLRTGLTRTYSQRYEVEKHVSTVHPSQESQVPSMREQAQDARQPDPSTPVEESPIDADFVTPRPLQLCTSFPRPCHHKKHLHVQVPDSDSPTLGMPGGFVDDDSYPTSAVSAMTGTTDIDNEEQTEEARYHHIAALKKSSTAVKSSSLVENTPSTRHAEDTGLESIQIAFNPRLSDSIEFERDVDLRPTDALILGALGGRANHALEDHGASLLLASAVTSIARHDPPSFRGRDKSGAEVSDSEPMSPSFAFNDAHRSMFQHPLANDRDYRRSAVERHRDDFRVSSRDSYDPFRVSSPSFQHSLWANPNFETDVDEDYKPPSLVVSNILRESNPPVMAPLSPSSPLVSEHQEVSPGAIHGLSTEVLAHSGLPTLTTHNGFGIGYDDSPVYTTPTVALWPENGSTTSSQPSQNLSYPPSRSPPSPVVLDAVDSNSASGPDSDTYSSQEPSLRPQSSTQVSMEIRSSEGTSSFEKERPSISLNPEELAALESTKRRLNLRSQCIAEIISTEAGHVKDLTVFQDIYKGTAEICPRLSPEDINLLFRNIDELVDFGTILLEDLKAAAVPIYRLPAQQLRYSRSTVNTTDTQPNDSHTPSTKTSEGERMSRATTLIEEIETRDQNDSKTSLGQVFVKHAERIGFLCQDWLASADAANKRFELLSKEPAVEVWTRECDLVAKELSNAWDYNSLSVKPFQRITRYVVLLAALKSHTSSDHPDLENIELAMSMISRSISDTNESLKDSDLKTKGKKRKESDIRGVFKGLLLRRTEKTSTKEPSISNSKDDSDFLELRTKFAEDFLRVQVVLRDVEMVARVTADWVQFLLNYFSAMELTMRATASNNPEVESKWARFNIAMRDMGTHIMNDHVAAVRQHVIHPFESIIRLYGPVELAMKQRSKRRLEFDRSIALKAQGKKVDSKLQQLVDEYLAVDSALKKELPKLSQLSTQMGLICLRNLVETQAKWWHMWQEKLKAFLEGNQITKDVDIDELVERFKLHDSCNRGLPAGLDICRKQFERESRVHGRSSRAASLDRRSALQKERSIASSARSRNASINSEKSPSLPTPDFAKRVSGQFQFSPINPSSPNIPPLPTQSFSRTQSRNGSINSATAHDALTPARTPVYGTARPSTGRSLNSNNGQVRDSAEYYLNQRRESGSTTNSARSPFIDGAPSSTRPQSGLIQAHPLPGLGLEVHDASARLSRASSRDRVIIGPHNVKFYKVIYVAASLFEFDIDTTKKEAGYPYLTYVPGEIFDVIAERGELWLAKNQDDISDTVGWIWCKHFVRMLNL